MELQPPLPLSANENCFVHLFELDMTSSQCGYPILCPGDQPRFKEVPFYPMQVTNLGIQCELKDLMTKCEFIFRETGLPALPCLFHHLCIPCSPVCAANHCRNQRKMRLDEAIRIFNQAIAQPRGIFVQWNNDYNTYTYNQNFFGTVTLPRQANLRAIAVLKPGLEVWINIQVRRKFCQQNGLVFEEPTTLAPSTAIQHQPLPINSMAAHHQNQNQTHFSGTTTRDYYNANMDHTAGWHHQDQYDESMAMQNHHSNLRNKHYANATEPPLDYEMTPPPAYYD